MALLDTHAGATINAENAASAEADTVSEFQARVRTTMAGASRRRRSGSSVVAGLALTTWALSGCQATPPPRPETARAQPQVIVDATALGADVTWVKDAVPAAERLLQAGGLALRDDVLVVVHHSVPSFAQATGRSEGHLRAWSRFGRVDLLPPSFWRDAGPDVAVERLAHELCHVAMWQRFASETAAKRARLPWAFSEGACSVVAGQERRRMPLDALVAFSTRSDSWDPIATPGRDSDVDYGAAHHALARVAREHGALVFVRVVDHAARAGVDGETAFHAVTGIPWPSLWHYLLAEPPSPDPLPRKSGAP